MEALVLELKPLTSKINELSNPRVNKKLCQFEFEAMEVCFFSDKNCGESRGLSSLFRLSECTDDIKRHLKTYHLSREDLVEYQLILARSGQFSALEEDVSTWWICPKHRHNLGKFWLPSRRSCNMPNHNGNLKVLSGRDVITLELARLVQKLYGITIQIGSGRNKFRVSKMHFTFFFF